MPEYAEKGTPPVPSTHLRVLAVLAGTLALAACTHGPPPLPSDAPAGTAPATTSAAPTEDAGRRVSCQWGTPEDPPTPSPLRIGRPPGRVPAEGHQTVTLETNRGVIEVEMDLAKTPCTAASIAYLAGAGYYDNSPCHRIVPTIFAVQCGDPTGTGSGGPDYTVADENLPRGTPAYQAGDVAMANVGTPDSNAAQFFFTWQASELQGDYSLFGHVTRGLDIVIAVGTGGDDGAFETTAGGGHPKLALILTKVTVSAIH